MMNIIYNAKKMFCEDQYTYTLKTENKKPKCHGHLFPKQNTATEFSNKIKYSGNHLQGR